MKTPSREPKSAINACAWGVVVGLVVGLAFRCCERSASAQDTLVDVHQLGVVGALWAARIAANEDSRPLRPINDGNGTCGHITDDWLGILQVAHNVSRSFKITLQETLLRMAPRVTGRLPSSSRAHQRSGTLPAKLIRIGTQRFEKPHGWQESDGPWDLYGPCWDEARKQMQQAVLRGFNPPCPGEPIAEGGAMDDDSARARGLIRLDCGDVLHFWAQP